MISAERGEARSFGSIYDPIRKRSLHAARFRRIWLSNTRPVLPEQVSLTRSLHMHIHEDHRRAAHVREVAAFIAAEVECNRSPFHAPTAPPVASPARTCSGTSDCSCAQVKVCNGAID